MTDTTGRDLPSMALFCERLKFALKREGLSQSDLARIVGTTPQNVQKLTTREKAEYTGSKLRQMAEALKVPVAWLACNENEGAPSTTEVVAGDSQMLNVTGLSPLQAAGLDALVNLMRAGAYDDEEVIDLLGVLKPRLAKLKSA